MLFPLAATIRQTLPGAERCTGRLTNAVSGAFWLVPMMLIVPMCVGLMLTGRLSPLPQIAGANMGAVYGPAVGLGVAIAVIITDLWLLLTPAMVVLRFTDPAKRRQMRAIIPFNLFLGASFLGIIYLVWR